MLVKKNKVKIVFNKFDYEQYVQYNFIFKNMADINIKCIDIS